MFVVHVNSHSYRDLNLRAVAVTNNLLRIRYAIQTRPLKQGMSGLTHDFVPAKLGMK